MPIKTYRTILGDTWDMIAYKIYGNEHRCSQLMEVNTDHRETTIFSSGIILTVPEIENIETQIKPPWKS